MVKKSPQKSQAARLVEYAKDVELFRSSDGEHYASVRAGSQCQTWPLGSQDFRQWLIRRTHKREGVVPKKAAVDDALALLAAKARFEGPEHAVAVRVAEQDGAVYLDLGDDSGRAVRVNAEGWEVVQDHPARFRRTGAMCPLPVPQRTDKPMRERLDELWRFLNVSDEDRPLVITWLLAAFRSKGPYPLLVLHGEQGSAKSTTTRCARDLIDPNAAPLRSESKGVRDLMIAANHSWVLTFDNLSHISPWLSDALCRLSTGGGFGTRKLYTNDEEQIFNAQRPVILNGIEDSATRPDLLDRVLIIYLPQIDEAHRQPEASLHQAFEEARPRILGALLDVLSEALRRLPEITLEGSPRMADFAVFGVAVERALGWEPGTFLAAYDENRQGADDLVLEHPLLPPLRRLLEGRRIWMTADGKIEETVGRWHGTAQDLLAALNSTVDELGNKTTRHLKIWPNTPKGLSNLLRRLQSNLRRVGIDIAFGKEGRDRDRRRVIMITREDTVPQDPESPGTEGTIGTVTPDTGPVDATGPGQEGDADNAGPVQEADADPEADAETLVAQLRADYDRLKEELAWAKMLLDTTTEEDDDDQAAFGLTGAPQ